jgi:hypothetical protein
MKRQWKYISGEDIRVGDVVKIAHWDAVVVAVTTKDSPEWIDYIGEGIMFEGPAFGRLHTEFINEDHVLIRRKDEPAA